MTEALKRYAKNASTDYLVQKYPGLPKDIIAERYIVQQARAAAWAGAASAIVVSAAFAGSIALASSIVAIPGLVVTVPIGIAAFAVETGYTVKLQLRTAYDLCNLYGLSVNPDDPEDVQEIFALGMGIKAGELTGTALQRLAPSVAMQQTRGSWTGIRRNSRLSKNCNVQPPFWEKSCYVVPGQHNTRQAGIITSPKGLGV
jgi:hypothetical protein